MENKMKEKETLLFYSLYLYLSLFLFGVFFLLPFSGQQKIKLFHTFILIRTMLTKQCVLIVATQLRPSYFGFPSILFLC